MTQLNITIRGGADPRVLRMDLDANLPNECTIAGFVLKNLLYEPDVSQLFMRVVQDGDTVIDIGGNVGWFTLLAAALVGPTGRVVTFEPGPENLVRLRRNIALSGFDNITVVEKAVTDHVGEVSFYINSDNSGANALWNPADHPEYVLSAQNPRMMTIPATTIDAEVERLGLADVKLIKCDVEGADQKALAGARTLLTGRGVPFVVSELNEFGLGRMGASQHGFRAMMAELGYDTFALFYSTRLPTLIPPATTLHGKNLLNVLFSSAADIGPYWDSYTHDPQTD